MEMISSFHSSADVLIPAEPATRAWPPQGKWTYEDYCRLPEDGWIYEVIEGELFMSPAPQTRHQLCKGKLVYKFFDFVEEHNVGMVLDAPYDVLLPGLATPVQPDVIFVLKERLGIVKEEHIVGVPDIVVEVLSPWNWHADRRKKFTVYAKAGVREYWIVDPKARTIELFCLRGSTYALIGKYGVGETVRSEVLSGFEVKVEEVCPEY
jgi:Uma2 family endonuclease